MIECPLEKKSNIRDKVKILTDAAKNHFMP